MVLRHEKRSRVLVVPLVSVGMDSNQCSHSMVCLRIGIQIEFEAAQWLAGDSTTHFATGEIDWNR